MPRTMTGRATLGDANNEGLWQQGPLGTRALEIQIPWTLTADGGPAFATATPDRAIDFTEAGLYLVTFTAQFRLGLNYTTTQPTNPAEAHAVIDDYTHVIS